MAESGAERTEQATPKRLEEARKKGQVPRSVELSMAAVCIAAAAAIYTLGRGAAGQFAELMRGSLSLRPEQVMSEGVIWPALMDAGLRSLIIILPILGATFIAALAAPLAIGGWNFSGEALMPKFSKLNPADRPRPHVLGARLRGARQGHRQGAGGVAHRLGAARRA